ncbi:MAG: hypothetical protein K9M49_00665 [Candidatus Marinimicrobia bacterium]|nr:hypothetical protein [Candidatus Neomarinimicrobiota bacterium]MCF7850626.1 hypothetical protein [Candidatus Neomarinimicrobiota bacterium]MCF7903640.1 hypothetical protein [Candidatus Neomarinimicrobiota bacterium]
MLKSDIDNSISTLINTIQECNIESMLQTIIEGETTVNTVEALRSYKEFIKHYQTYNDADIQLLNVIGLGDLTQESLWSRFVKPEESDTPEVIAELRNSIHFLMNHLPRVQELRAADGEKIQAVIDAGKNAGVEYVTLSVVVIEEEELTTPERLIFMMDAIQTLYEVFGRMVGSPYQNLIVTSCDSGNDKVFDFLGTSTIIGGVKDIILSYWDRVVFYREDKQGEYVKLVTQSLPVIEVINKMENDGKLEKEEAEILRRKVVSSMTKLSRAGITIPEMEEHAHQNPRELLRPDRKELTGSIYPEENLELSGEYPAVVEGDEEDPDDFDVDYYPNETEAAEPVPQEDTEPEPEAEAGLEPEPEPEPEMEAVDQETSEPEPTEEEETEPELEPEESTDPDPEPELEPEPAEEPNLAAEPEEKIEEPAVDPFGDLDEKPSITESFDESPIPDTVSEAEPAPEVTSEPDPTPEPVPAATDNFEDSDAFGVPPDKSAPKPDPEPEGPVKSEKDYSNLGEDIYMQAGVDDVEVILDNEPLSAPAAPADPPPEAPVEPAHETVPEPIPDPISEEEQPEAPTEAASEERPAKKDEGAPVAEEEDEATKKFDEEIDNVFERIAAGFLEMKKEEAEKESAQKKSNNPEEEGSSD